MTAARGVAPVFLRRAGMFSLVLALIAGLFGMHVMNGHHLNHGPASATAAAGSAGTSHHSHSAGAAAPGVASGASGTAAGEELSASAECQDGDCSATQAMAVSCIPSGKTGTLAAPVPGTAEFAAAHVRAGPAGQVTSRSAHRPATPTPCELSISRT